MSLMAEARAVSIAVRARVEEIGPLWLLLLAPALVLGFGTLAEEVSEGDTTDFDRYVLLLFHVPHDPSRPIGPAWLQEAARDVTSFGSVSWLGFIFLAVVGFLWLSRKRDACLLMLAAVGGGQLISTLLKIWFERPRPDLIPNAPQVFTASFPSGHAMLSAVTYLTLGALLTHRLRLIKQPGNSQGGRSW
ncbi:phosphatase PAP2 family protein [Alsobacter metallidurans]|nr:phosphatase PAP2 family protein [Alsobacter metallidurans]